MRSYKIVASDLDGTLLNNASQVSRENMDAIAGLATKGVWFVPCSGRTFAEIPQEIRENENIRYIIHSNGATVLDKQTGHRIETGISNALIRKILDVLNACQMHLTIRHGGNCYVDARYQTQKDFDYYNVIVPHQDCVINYATHSNDFVNLSYGLDNAEVVSAFFHDYDEKLACRKLLEADGRLRVVEASEYNLEIMNIEAGKGNALYALCDLLGVAYEDTISMGDSDNDSSVTQAAGLGLAVENACDALKAIADELICSNEDHAVAYVLNHYF